ncbi:hypothetical protein [Streptomyces youssoufiensis]
MDAATTEAGLRAWHGQLGDAEAVVRNRTRMVDEVTRLAPRAEEAKAGAARADAGRERLEGALHEEATLDLLVEDLA